MQILGTAHPLSMLDSCKIATASGPYSMSERYCIHFCWSSEEVQRIRICVTRFAFNLTRCSGRDHFWNHSRHLRSTRTTLSAFGREGGCSICNPASGRLAQHDAHRPSQSSRKAKKKHSCQKCLTGGDIVSPFEKRMQTISSLLRAGQNRTQK